MKIRARIRWEDSPCSSTKGTLLLKQIAVLARPFAQTQQVSQAGGVVRPSPGRGRLRPRRQLPGTFPNAEAEGLITALVLHKAVNRVIVVVDARAITLHIAGGEVIQAQRVVSVDALSYTESVIHVTLADAEREWPCPLQVNLLRIKK